MGGPEKELAGAAAVGRGPGLQPRGPSHGPQPRAPPPDPYAHRIFTHPSPLLHDRGLFFAQERWADSAGPFGIDAHPGHTQGTPGATVLCAGDEKRCRAGEVALR